MNAEGGTGAAQTLRDERHDTSGVNQVKKDALEILGSRRTMAISTVRPDGWPQTTIVGYANDGFDIYFMIFRSSQKFANIGHDNRVSLAVGGEARDLSEAKAVFAGANAGEVIDPAERARAWEMLVRRHPNLADFEPPDGSDAVMMRARCKHLSLVDYTKGLGHKEAFTLGDDTAVENAR